MAQFSIPSNNTSNKGKDDIEWTNVDPTSLPKPLLAKFDALHDCMEQLAKLKKSFETDFSSACNVEDGYRMIFSYKYGKEHLACGVVPEKKAGRGQVAFTSLTKKGK